MATPAAAPLEMPWLCWTDVGDDTLGVAELIGVLVTEGVIVALLTVGAIVAPLTEGPPAAVVMLVLGVSAEDAVTWTI